MTRTNIRVEGQAASRGKMEKSVVVGADFSASIAAQPSIWAYRNIAVRPIEDVFVIDITALQRLYPAVVFKPSVERARLNSRRAHLIGDRNARAIERKHVVGRADAVDRDQTHQHLRHGWQARLDKVLKRADQTKPGKKHQGQQVPVIQLN